MVLDPDAQIRETIAYFFETFSRVGSACQTVKVFRDEGLRFPSRLRNRDGDDLPAADRIDGDAHAAQPALRGRLRVRPPALSASRRREEECSESAQLQRLARLHPERSSRLHHLGAIPAEPQAPRDQRPRLRRRARLAAARGCGAAAGARGVRAMRQTFPRRDTPRGAEGWRHGTSATARTALAAEPNCQSIAGPPIDEAIGALVAEKMTPAAVELALEIRREIEARYEEADQLRRRAVERAQIEADLAQRRFMLVDPEQPPRRRHARGANGTTSCAHWPRRERNESASGRRTELVLDDAIRERLVAMTTDFKRLWADPGTPNRERKRMLAYIIEDVTLVKLPAEGTTKVHVRFKGGKTETLTTLNPKSSAQQVKTQPRSRRARRQAARRPHLRRDRRPTQRARNPPRRIGAARPRRRPVHRLAGRLSRPPLWPPLALRPTAGPGNADEDEKRQLASESTRTRSSDGRSTASSQGTPTMPTRTCTRQPGPNPPIKHCSRWDRLVDRAAAIKTAKASKSSHQRRRCSMKTVGSRTGSCHRRSTTAA